MRCTAIIGTSKLGKEPWRPGKKVTAVALLGGCEIDFRKAELEEGVTEVNATSILGDVNIVVNPGIPVTLSGISIGGTRGISDSLKATASSHSGKSIHIKTFCLIGGCYVSETSEYEFQWDNSISTKKKV
jgi:high-affinity K+ transport system ATPase subunit B